MMSLALIVLPYFGRPMHFSGVYKLEIQPFFTMAGPCVS